MQPITMPTIAPPETPLSSGLTMNFKGIETEAKSLFALNLASCVIWIPSSAIIAIWS